MKERPILFSAPMVRAILDGSKTQTRRVVKPQPEFPIIIAGDPHTQRFQLGERHPMTLAALLRLCPYGQPGDRLWVRETWGYFDPDGSGEDYEAKKNEDGGSGPCKNYCDEMMQEGNPLRDYWRRRVTYAATWQDGKYGAGAELPKRWRPSIHMPRWASRITLEITGVRVERLQDISAEDCIAEGIKESAVGRLITFEVPETPIEKLAPRPAFEKLWQLVNGPGSWQANPWVWVIEFKRVHT